ncbi:MAG: type II secretion system protein [Planctomycetaceae bacterium]
MRLTTQYYASMSLKPQGLKQQSLKPGFTLVELLVSIVLVSIMMLAFSRVFQLATDTIVQTRGLSSNDESARMLTTIIKEDLDTRTFRTVAPWKDGEDPSMDYPTIESLQEDKRRGYFYVSENLVEDESDDILQLVIDRYHDGEDPGRLLYGKADSFATSNPYDDINQPSNTDSTLDELGNRGIGASQYGEVAYFLRNGNLFRRVLLLHTPVIGDNFQPISGTDGTTGSLLITGDYDAGEDSTLETDDSDPADSDFWNDFDYSAYHNGSTVLFNGDGNDIGDSNNSLRNDLALGLGIPKLRFGFDYATGLPREYVNSDADFIGRYTHQETSDPDFGYPGRLPGGFSPMSSADTSGYTISDGVVTGFEDGPRVAEDLLLSNVLSFDVKLWDEGVNRFVDVGHADGAGGDLNVSQVDAGSSAYGPQGSSDHIFDTAPGYRSSDRQQFTDFSLSTS